MPGSGAVKPVGRRQGRPDQSPILQEVRPACNIEIPDGPPPHCQRVGGFLTWLGPDPAETTTHGAIMTIRSQAFLAVVLALASLATPARAQDFPKDLVAWQPIPGNPVFRGDRAGARLGPENP